MQNEGPSMLELYYFPLSTTSQKVRLCQTYKGVALREHVIDLGQLQHMAPEYLAINPRAEVPALVADGQVITESSIINEYLEERFPEPGLLPRDRLLRARVRMWNRFVDAGATQALAVPTYQLWVRPLITPERREALGQELKRMPLPSHRERWLRILGRGYDETEISQALAVVEATFARMEEALGHGRFLVGDEYSLADVESTPIVVRALHLNRADLWSDKPRLAAWFERIRALPSFDHTYGFLQTQASSQSVAS
jgi:glutathione S-transferase